VSKPQVVTVPSSGNAVQIPLLGGSAVTLVNLSNYFGLTLCADDTFENYTTWPLGAGLASPQVGQNTLWIKNENVLDVQVLVYQGIIPVSNLGATPAPYTILDNTIGPTTLAGPTTVDSDIQPTSTYGIILLTILGTAGTFEIAGGTIRLFTADMSVDLKAYVWPLETLDSGDTLEVIIPIPPGIFEILRVTINGTTTGDAEILVNIFESNANLNGFQEITNGTPSGTITNYALETGGNLAALASALVLSKATPGNQLVRYLSDSVGNLPTGILVGGITANMGDYYPIKVATDGTVAVSATFTSPPSVNATIVGPLDGSGNVKVAVENTPAVTISGTLPPFASTPAVTISGTLPPFASEPTVKIDGSSGSLPPFASTPTVDVGNPITNYALETGGNLDLQTAALDTIESYLATIDGGMGQIGAASLPVYAMMAGGSDGTHPRLLLTDAGGQLKVLVENTVPISGATNATIVSPLDGSGNVKVAVENTPAVTISGTLPAFATEPTVKIDGSSGSLPPFATTPAVNATVAGPLDGSGNVKVAVENTPAVTISGTLPAFATEPTVKIDGTSGSLPPFASTPAVTISGTLPPFASPPSVNATVVGPLDGSGNVKVAVENTPAVTISGTLPLSAVPSNSTVGAYVQQLHVKASAGTFYGLTGYNAATVTQFIQLIDAAALVSGTTVPAVVFSVPASTSFALDYSKGRAFATGIWLVASSTGPVYTTGVATSCWFDAQYV
jgi:hypothetical protein